MHQFTLNQATEIIKNPIIFQQPRSCPCRWNKGHRRERARGLIEMARERKGEKWIGKKRGDGGRVNWEMKRNGYCTSTFCKRGVYK